MGYLTWGLAASAVVLRSVPTSLIATDSRAQCYATPSRLVLVR